MDAVGQRTISCGHGSGRRTVHSLVVSKGQIFMSKKLAISIFVSLLVICLAQGAYSDVTERVDGCSSRAGCYMLTGPITEKDATAIENIVHGLQQKGHLTPRFDLNSSGGDIISAMKIGRLIRKIRGIVLIAVPAKCYSSCVFVLAGGTQRLVGGEVGIHRPYFIRTGKLTYEEGQRDYAKLRDLSREYLFEMNLPGALFDAMVKVPSEQIRILSKEEVSFFGLNQTDIVEQDLQDSADAQRYGVSKVEYLTRKSRAEAICKSMFERADFAGWAQCKDAVMSGKK